MLSAVALVLLASMIDATNRLVTRSKQSTKDYMAQSNVVVEKDEHGAGAGTVVFVERVGGADSTLTLTDHSGDYIPVLYYINNSISNVSVTSYKKDG